MTLRSLIYTRQGDDGRTGLANGQRIEKSDERIEALGAIDELNSWLGLVAAPMAPDWLTADLREIQHRLFDLGSEIALSSHRSGYETAMASLETRIDILDAALPPLTAFILPGGSEAAARCHLARSVCRRAERHLVRLRHREPIPLFSLSFINRLSDYLFVAARALAHRAGDSDIPWRKSSPSMP
ncbi:MAG: cob(I)yrinic acid a,c-diamide adenosyltransferase [Pseudomonadota bacterium]